MRKVSEILKDKPVIGSYIRFEKKLLNRIETAYKNYKKRPSFGESLSRVPLIGPVARFPGAAAEWLKDLPVIGPLGFRPAFALASFMTDTFIRKPVRFTARFIGVPLLAAGIASAYLQDNPGMVSETFNDYAQRQGVDAALLDGVAHKNIRIYKDDNTLGLIFHAAGRQVAVTRDVANQAGANPLLSSFMAAAAYPMHLVTTAAAVVDERNAFAIPALSGDETVFIRTISDDVDPVSMIAALSGLDERYLNVDREALERWMPLFVLGHEGRHADNGKVRMEAAAELLALRDEAAAIRAAELERLMIYGNMDYEEAAKTVQDSDRYKDALRDVRRKAREVERLTLQGETDSDVYIAERLERQFPEAHIAETVKHARAIFPFAGDMNRTSNHATASGLEAHIRDIESAGAFNVWDAIDMTRALIRIGTLLDDNTMPLLGVEKTVRNYQVARDIVIPYLEANRDRYLPRDERHVRYALVLEQAQMFVDGMEYLVKPEVLEGLEPVSPVTIPNLKPQTNLTAPYPAF